MQAEMIGQQNLFVSCLVQKCSPFGCAGTQTIGKSQNQSIISFMSIEPDQIKKLRVRYLRCTKGDLHEGEVLNFICIDPACRAKGLICPVCQNTTHEGHKTLHLKLFLSEISRTLYNQDDSSELSGLSEYLRSLDSSKREMIKSLKEMVEQLAGKVREVQEKIENGYCLLRKIILSQSTVSMRLPELYRLLTQNDSLLDQEEIYRQISRYSELLQYKDGKVITVDSSKNLITEYASKAGSLSAHLTSVITETAKIFNALPLQVSKFGTSKEKTVVVSNATYSSTVKSSGVNVVSDKKVSLAADCYGGIVFTTSTSEETVKKISFKVVESPEGGAITLGVANPELYKDRNYEINYQGEPGVYGMCSFGFLPEDLEGEAFLYAVGDTIDMTWNTTEKKLTFARRHGIEKCETTIPVEEEGDAKNLAFFTMLTGPGDTIEIVE